MQNNLEGLNMSYTVELYLYLKQDSSSNTHVVTDKFFFRHEDSAINYAKYLRSQFAADAKIIIVVKQVVTKSQSVFKIDTCF